MNNFKPSNDSLDIPWIESPFFNQLLEKSDLTDKQKEVITKKEAADIINENKKKLPEDTTTLNSTIFPAYTTAVGWLGYSDDKMSKLAKENLFTGVGFNEFYSEDWRQSVGLVRYDTDEYSGRTIVSSLSIHNSFLDLMLETIINF